LAKLDKLENIIEASDRESKERHEALQNKLDKLETSHRELKESNGKLQKNIEIKLEKLRENIKTDLKTETEKLIQRFDLASEIQVVEVSNQEKTDVILSRQWEQAEQRLVEENKVGNSDSDSLVTKGNISECNDVSFVSHTPCIRKKNANSPSMPRPSRKTEMVGVKASRVNYFASNVATSNRVNDSKRVLLSFKDSFEMFHSKQLGEVLQISVPTKTNASKLEHQCSKRSQRKYRHLHRYNPLCRNLRQNFRGGTYTKKNEGREQTQGVPSNCVYCK
jgi:hypothetical protein